MLTLSRTRTETAMASITQYREKTWRAVVSRAGFKRVSKTFERKEDALRWARSIEAQQDRGMEVNVKEARKQKVADLFARYRDEITPNKKTARGETNTINRFLRNADFVHRRLDQIKPDDIRAWRDHRLTEIDPQSVHREMTVASSIFTHAIKEWGAPLTVNPVMMVKRPAGADKVRNRRWSEEDIQAVLKAAGWREDQKPITTMEYVGWAFLVAIETAMRQGEICKVLIKDFYPTDRYLMLYDTKNGDSRAVPLSLKALHYLTFITEGRAKTEKIFPMVAGTLDQYFRKARDQSGLKSADLRFHDARHEAATRLSKKLSNILELSAVTGHRSLRHLKRYYNPTPSEIAQRLD
jgi:integrase